MHEIKFQHIILTRFSIRAKDVFKRRKMGKESMWQLYGDPLDKNRLNLRFKLFEMICLPSVLNQSNRNFQWILIIDRLLPPSHKKLLEDLTSHERIHLYEYNDEDDLECLDWVQPFVKDTPDYFLTTNLDDDDALPITFVESIQTQLRSTSNQDKIQPFNIIGISQIRYWDMIFTRKAPLGWKAIQSENSKTSSVGFSLYCKYPDLNYNVLGLRHPYAQNYFDLTVPPDNLHVKKYRELFKLSELNKSTQLVPSDLYFDLSETTGPVLMVNHTVNVQARRLFIRKRDQTIVSGTEDFPNVIINWKKVEEYSGSFTKRQALRKLVYAYILKRYKASNYKSVADYYRNFLDLLMDLIKR